MMIRSVAVFGLLTWLAATPAMWAKGDMVLIEVKGGTLTTPIKITDPRISEFNVWAGPGANEGVLENATRFIIDWQAGFVAQHPAGLQHYEVFFYAGCKIPDDPQCRAEKPRLVYVVPFDFDPTSGRGFVYLPRYGELWFEVNSGTIYHRVEGHWFLASDSWGRFVRPFITKGTNGDRGHSPNAEAYRPAP
jgi:hypothetical protein